MPSRSKMAPGLSSLMGSDSEPDSDSITSPGVAVSRGAAQGAGHSKPHMQPPSSLGKVKRAAQRAGSHRTAGFSRKALQERSRNTAQESRKASAESGPAHDMDQLDFEESDTQSPQKRGRPKASEKGGTGQPVRKKVVPKKVMETASAGPVEVDPGDGSEIQGSGDEATEGNSGSDTNDHEMEYFNETPSDSVLLQESLAELTERYSNLEVRYKDLREIGIKEAERNYDRLKKQSDDSAAAATRLIAELRSELARQSELAKQHERSEARCEDLRANVAELNTSLSEARSEIKTLSTKLTAARNAEVNLKVPGSALKSTSAQKLGPSAENLQAAQAKEDLYGDLTGLIIRGRKQGDKEDVFDCIQTGRNGTLHFKLALDTAEAVENYEDVQYTYRPQLDPNRDQELQMVLPDYLLEEITFPRTHASKFFTRVTKSLTERLD